MLFNHLAHLGQFVTSKSPRFRQCHRLQPELGVLFCALDMNVSRLMALSAEKEKPKPAGPQNCGHRPECITSAGRDKARSGARVGLTLDTPERLASMPRMISRNVSVSRLIQISGLETQSNISGVMEA